jgi:predicted hydrolase (HD superfamily)
MFSRRSHDLASAPSKQVADVRAKSILKRMKEPRFAATVNRDSILLCEAIGIPLAEFVELSLRSMTRVAPDIGHGGTVQGQ